MIGWKVSQSESLFMLEVTRNKLTLTSPAREFVESVSVHGVFEDLSWATK